MAQFHMAFLHSHALFWLITIILFLLTVLFIKNGKGKISKIFQMTLRLFYVLVTVTGLFLIYINDFSLRQGQFHWEFYVKGLLAFWLIFVMELITTRMAKGTLKGKGHLLFWGQFIVALLLVLYFGYGVTG
ncbi:YisL family protein [Evansella sp. AB-P1]|uniref:YisL family protein n=1 Tax=Evansella sp. AB-P1 TaxID=3037653 RepID=UPI00241E62B5|nr:YisL family protein [Evansella sp. AB-P1]MDG5786831.1 YisL family protein [Evansella sp. AB-P1]